MPVWLGIAFALAVLGVLAVGVQKGQPRQGPRTRGVTVRGVLAALAVVVLLALAMHYA